ncbi:hypothetical protein AgCh_018621 [Apium graveolens]
MALQFISYSIAAGENVSLWFEPWWGNICLANTKSSAIISQCELHHSDKGTVEKMSVEMFHIHTSMVAATEKMNRLSKVNEKLEIEKQELELQLNKHCANIAIGLDYEAGSSQKKSQIDKENESVNKEVPSVLQKANAALFKDVALVAGLEVNLLVSVNSQTKVSRHQVNKAKKLSYLNYKAINTLVKRELVRDMPNLEFAQNEVCEACQKGKIKRSSHKSKYVNSINAPVQLIHMDLFSPVNVMSISKKKYALVMVDDNSRYTLVEFMHSKDETSNIIIEYIKKIEK